MNTTKYLIPATIFFMFFISVSCKKNTGRLDKEQLTTAIEQTGTGKDYKWIVVLPGAGCHGCIQEGEGFMRDNIKNENILFVLTSVSSMKILQQKIGTKVNEHSNVYIDKEGLFKIPSHNSIYPCIIYQKNGRITDFEFQSPKNSAAFQRFEKLVKTE